MHTLKFDIYGYFLEGFDKVMKIEDALTEKPASKGLFSSMFTS